MRSLGDSIFRGKITRDKADKEQSNMLENILQFNNRSNLNLKADKYLKSDTFKSINAFYKGRELLCKAFKIGVFPLKSTQATGIKILHPKRMLQGLPIAFAQVKACNTSENLLNKIRQIVYALY